MPLYMITAFCLNLSAASFAFQVRTFAAGSLSPDLQSCET